MHEYDRVVALATSLRKKEFAGDWDSMGIDMKRLFLYIEIVAGRSQSPYSSGVERCTCNAKADSSNLSGGMPLYFIDFNFCHLS